MNTTYIRSFDNRRLLGMDEPMSEELKRFRTRVVLDDDKEFVEEYKPHELDARMREIPKPAPEAMSVGKILDIKHQIGKRNRFRVMG